VPTAPSAEVAGRQAGAYEDAIRAAGREVGGHYLAEGQITAGVVLLSHDQRTGVDSPGARAYTPDEGEDLQDLVQIAFTEGVHPRKGFDWVLKRYGLCSAITTMSQEAGASTGGARLLCPRPGACHLRELRDRLSTEITRHEGTPPLPALLPETPGVVRRLIEGRAWLFDEDAYHIDMSHSVPWCR